MQLFETTNSLQIHLEIHQIYINCPTFLGICSGGGPPDPPARWLFRRPAKSPQKMSLLKCPRARYRSYFLDSSSVDLKH